MNLDLEESTIRRTFEHSPIAKAVGLIRNHSDYWKFEQEQEQGWKVLRKYFGCKPPRSLKHEPPFLAEIALLASQILKERRKG